MAEPSLNYFIDTSSLVHAYQRSYPPDVFPALWNEKLDELIEAGQLISPYDVYEELEKNTTNFLPGQKKGHICL